MIEQLFTMGTSLLFLLIGYWLGYSRVSKDTKPTKYYPVLPSNETLPKSKKSFLQKAGVIEYPSQGDIDYRESGEEKVDKERERVFREQFKQ